MIFSHLASSLKPSPTVTFSAKAKVLKEEGFDVVDFSVGDPSIDPEFKLPQEIIDKAVQAISEPVSYTAPAGLMVARKAIAKKMLNDYGLSYDPATQITIGCGVKQLIFNAFLATINPQDEIIIPAPYWVSYVDMVECMQGKAVVVDTALENKFLITAKQIEENITDKTKWLILNSPNNPTGMVYSEQDLRDIASVLKKYPNVHVLSDDIYEYNLMSDDIKFANIVSVDPSLQSRVLLVNGTAKSHAMTGWRIGYAAGNAEIIKNLTKLQSQTTTNACTISQKALIAAIENGNKAALQLRPMLQQRLQIINEELKDTGLTYNIPDATFYIFCSMENFLGKSYQGQAINSCADFCSILLEKFHTVVTPGYAFGKKNHFRISFASGLEQAKEGAKRIKQFISEIQ